MIGPQISTARTATTGHSPVFELWVYAESFHIESYGWYKLYVELAETYEPLITIILLKFWAPVILVSRIPTLSYMYTKVQKIEYMSLFWQ